ncbi:MAG: hypothetical protein IJ723_02230, partial [Ruminococcus sp.]|nr:hypothetical protein [Ruminococcus sp.]
MKRVLLLTTILVLLISMVSCGNTSSEKTESKVKTKREPKPESVWEAYPDYDTSAVNDVVKKFISVEIEISNSKVKEILGEPDEEGESLISNSLTVYDYRYNVTFDSYDDNEKYKATLIYDFN